MCSRNGQSVINEISELNVRLKSKIAIKAYLILGCLFKIGHPMCTSTFYHNLPVSKPTKELQFLGVRDMRTTDL